MAEIDANMIRLVDVLNRFPGVRTFSCCGGHQDPINGQAPAEEFNVSLDLDRDANGWRSLEWLAWTIRQTDGPEKVVLKTWLSGDEPQSLAFVLEGQDGADPDALAEALQETLDRMGV